jgi:Arc/MetJ family transcription regulator
LTLFLHLVYLPSMRTNIDLDEALLAEAAKYSTSRSKRRLIQEALATFVAVKAEERRRATYRERLERVRGRLADIRLRSDLRDLIRADRDSR